MATINVRELEEQLAKIPDIEPIDIKRDLRGAHAALFLCALGFEPRCLTIPEYLASAGVVCEKAVFFEYQSNPAENDANRPALVSQLRKVSTDVEPMDLDAPDFTQRVRSLFLNLGRRGTPPRVIIDISAFGNRVGFKLYAVLLTSNVDALLLYSEAAIYHPTQEEYLRSPNKWGAQQDFGLERGVSNITVSPEHPGQFLDPLPDFAIIFPAFGPDRSKAALEWIDPSLVGSPSQKVMWMVGVPHLEPDRWRLGAIKTHHAITEETLQAEVSTFAYKDTMRALHAACEKYSETHNITFVPLGSKFQAVGGALSCLIHPEVRVLFPIPREYNAATYSDGTKATWKIDFGPISALRSKLLDVGTLEIIEAEAANTILSGATKHSPQ